MKKHFIIALILLAQPLFAQETFLRWLTTFTPDWIEGKTPPASPANESGITPGATIPSLWLPMCFFFDEAIESDSANEKIAYLAGAYAACGIVLKPYAFTLKRGYPAEAQTLIEAAKRACPIEKTFAVRGAIQLETTNETLPKQMCQDPEAKGCSTLCSPLSVSLLSANAGKEAGLHESMHSNCCGPVCVNEGEGSGKKVGGAVELASNQPLKSTQALPKAKLSAIEELTPEGCAALQRGASPNHFNYWFEPQKKDYYRVEQQISRQVDLNSNRVALVAPVSSVQVPQAAYLAEPPSLNHDFRRGEEVTKTTSQVGKPEINRETKQPTLRKPASLEVLTASEGPEPAKRERGSGLRKGNDPSRKSTSDIGYVDAYSGAEVE